MRKLLSLFVMIILLSTVVFAVSEAFNYNSKDYYIVTSTDPTEDTGDEVCEKLGMDCVGYTAQTTVVCKNFHSDAATTSSLDGDISGVYCDGTPQSGICATKSNTCHICPECSAGVDCATPIGGLYREMYVECSGRSWFTGFQNFFKSIWEIISKFFASLGSLFSGTTVTIKNVTIGPYPGKWACDFYQIPFPGSNKKHVSCPYETPGAAINEAADAFCRTVMSSAWAVAEKCDENGIIICTHPCETTPAHIIPQRCAFDNDRQRGNQAPPLNWCAPKEPVTVPSGEGRPDDCFDTAYQAHKGYNENQALWDQYTAETDGVCQSTYGRSVPSPCVYTVQLSTSGNPYYLCWYNNP
ncbi:MAG: hypothetical protein ABIE55_01330 [Candidatus Aenigmatarchaeota archaeon]